jgi:signal transduction histidine kinase
LEAAFDAQRRFAANASHDLRTPLTTMRAGRDRGTCAVHRSPVALSKPAEIHQIVKRYRKMSVRDELDCASARLGVV